MTPQQEQYVKAMALVAFNAGKLLAAHTRLTLDRDDEQALAGIREISADLAKLAGCNLDIT